MASADSYSSPGLQLSSVACHSGFWTETLQGCGEQKQNLDVYFVSDWNLLGSSEKSSNLFDSSLPLFSVVTVTGGSQPIPGDQNLDRLLLLCLSFNHCVSVSFTCAVAAA